VWLDRGEIDKLAAETVDITRPKSSRSDRNHDRGTRDRDDLPTGEDRDKSDRYNQDRDKKDRDKKDRKKRRKSFGERLADVLEEIID
jgi:Zn-finger nucleic acid-binding protein